MNFFDSFNEFLRTQELGYVYESFSFTNDKGKEFTVCLSIEEVSPDLRPEERPRFDDVRKMLDYIKEHDGEWLAADVPSLRYVGYTNMRGEDHVTISLSSIKRTKHLLTEEERECLGSAMGRRKLIELLKGKKNEDN